jgi:quercetin dioxygenase-like cupin family protein
VKQWDLTSLPPSTEKQVPRAPGPDAARVARQNRQIPRVLFSAPECRVVAVELERGETMGEHHVRERALVQVVNGHVSIEASGETADCRPGALVAFDRGEPHSVRALADSMLLLILAPWPAAGHYTQGETGDPQDLPPNASAEPTESADAGP